MTTFSHQPLVSICIPAYNNESFIKETIDCVLAQTYSHWELVISDDCSKDRTVEIIKSYKDSRIRLVEHKTNLGLVGNWNSLVNELKGEYVKLLCGDDLIHPTCIEKQLEVFLSGKYTNVSLVACYTDLINEEGEHLFTKKYPFNKGIISAKKAIVTNFIFGTNTIGEPGSGLFKREAYAKIGIYDASNSYTVDMDFWLRVLLLGDLYIVPESLAYFRINQGANTTKIKKTQSKLFRQFAKKIYDDKRFGLSLFHYYVACVSSFIMQYLRGTFLSLYLK